METNLPLKPFDKIAVSLSGGGYRAAAYHLGTLSYLWRLKYRQISLLERVKLISTVSGGTLTGLSYAIGRADNQKFELIFRELVEKLRNVDLVSEGLEMLNPNAKWDNPSKRKNLINAFARLYDTHFTQGKTLKDILETDKDELVFAFNSTEFTNAINFRFRSSTRHSGNAYNRIPYEIAGEVKLSDIMAASSCFPGGFEPLLWPHDFVYEGARGLQTLSQSTRAIGIMDGGIYDNQGVGEILKYRNRDDGIPYFELVLVSDVTSPVMEAFTAASEAEKKEGFYKWTLNELQEKARNIEKQLTVISLVLFAATAIAPFLWNYDNSILTGLSLGVSGMSLLFFIAQRIVVHRLRSAVMFARKRVVSAIPEFFRDKLKALQIGGLSLHRVEPLLLDRLNSVLSLLMNVFLKVVRRLNYDTLYEDPAYRHRRISSLIRRLIKEQPEPAQPASSGASGPVEGERLKDIVSAAANFGTTLWFTDEDTEGKMLDKLLITGQATLCFNMIGYIEGLLKDADSEHLTKEDRDALGYTLEQCRDDWSAFNKDPRFMLKKLLPGNPVLSEEIKP